MADENAQLKKALSDYAAEHRQLTSPDPSTPPLPDLNAMADATRDEFLQDLRNAKRRQRVKQGTDENLLPAWLRGFRLKVLVPVVALVVVCLVTLTNVTPAGFVVSADPGDRAFTPGQANLPDQVRVDFKRGEIEFFGDGDKLAGTLTALNDETTRDIAAFHASVKGKDSTGVAGSFEGRVLFTRSESGKAPTKKSDITKILVTGELRVTGAGAFQINRTYLP